MNNITAFFLWILVLAAYFQHVVTTWANDSLFLFFSGLFIPPIGVIHGLLIWAGLASS